MRELLDSVPRWRRVAACAALVGVGAVGAGCGTVQSGMQRFKAHAQQNQRPVTDSTGRATLQSEALVYAYNPAQDLMQICGRVSTVSHVSVFNHENRAVNGTTFTEIDGPDAIQFQEHFPGADVPCPDDNTYVLKVTGTDNLAQQDN